MYRLSMIVLIRVCDVLFNVSPFMINISSASFLNDSYSF